MLCYASRGEGIKHSGWFQSISKTWTKCKDSRRGCCRRGGCNWKLKVAVGRFTHVLITLCISSVHFIHCYFHHVSYFNSVISIPVFHYVGSCISAATLKELVIKQFV